MSEDPVVYGRSGFALQPANMGEALRMAEMLSQSQLVPKDYQGNPQDTLVAMMMGHELGLNPIQSLQNIAVINGKPSIYGDAMAALMLHHPAFGGMEESFDDATMTATCTVWRKGRARHTQTFSETDAKLAGLWGKRGKTGAPTPWVTYPKRMLQMRARGFAIRSQFADALAGLITREEAEDMPAERDITPAPNSVPLEITQATAPATPEAPRPVLPAAEPQPAKPQTRMAVFNADGSIHSEHATMGAWLDAFEDLAASADNATSGAIISHNALGLKAIDVRGAFDVRLSRVMELLSGVAPSAPDNVPPGFDDEY